jgi:hypothetical protein
MTNDNDQLLAQQFRELLRRYTGATPEAFIDVLCPILIPINRIDPEIFKVEGQSHWRASFDVQITEHNVGILCRGRTGKFVPGVFAGGGLWREIAKGRIIDVDPNSGIASGEIYTGGTKADLENSLQELSINDLLEIDQYGAAAKVLSGLAEHSLGKQLTAQGCNVKRMPEDMARHLGAYANYDFEVTRGDQKRKVEVKSLWGTNTKFARLIHSTTTKPKGNPENWTEQQKSNYYPTSSCKFSTQDIFAVSLFLRTGNISDFAFARSVPKDIADYGLPRASKFPEHVNQNPSCEVGDGTWFANIDEVWGLA